MNIKEQIKAEIQRQRQFIEGLFTEGDNSFYDGQDDAYNHILAFLDSLPEQPASEELEEAAERWCKENGRGFVLRDKAAYYIGETLPAFKAGAEWGINQCPLPEDTTIFQKGVAEGKRLMMEDATEAVVTTNLANRPIIYLDQLQGFQYGDKVKIIIVKED